MKKKNKHCFECLNDDQPVVRTVDGSMRAVVDKVKGKNTGVEDGQRANSRHSHSSYENTCHSWPQFPPINTATLETRPHSNLSTPKNRTRQPWPSPVDHVIPESVWELLAQAAITMQRFGVGKTFSPSSQSLIQELGQFRLQKPSKEVP